MWSILDLINDWYDDGEENKLIRRVLWCEVVNSYHVNGRTIYSWLHSLPSGHPLTTVINSIYNHIAFRHCWVDAHDGKITSLESFNDEVYVVSYGDDNVVNVSDKSMTFFN